MSELRNKSIGAAFWSLSGTFGKTALAFVVFAIIGRKIGPEIYGLVGMITVISRFAMVFCEAGFTAALIQKEEVEEKHFSSVFWINVFMGVTAMAIFAACAPLVSSFYEKPELYLLTIVLSATFVIYTFQLVQKAQLTRKLNLKIIAAAETASVLIAGVVAIALAYSGLGVWALVVQILLLGLITNLIFWFASDWKPKMVFDWGAIKEMLNFSLNHLGTTSLNYWVRNLDKILIGKYLGDTMLGIYGRAYQTMLIPATNLSRSISRVLFPALSKIQNEPERVKAAYLKVCRIIALLIFPLMLGICASAPHFVEVMLGTKWMAMVPVLRILCLVGLIQSVSSLIGNLYLSQGRTDLQFRVTFLLRVILISSVVVGLKWGITGVASCYLAAVCFNQFPNLYFAGGLVGLTFREYVENLMGPLLASLLSASVVFLLVVVLHDRTIPWLAFPIEVIGGGAVYLATIHFSNLTAYQELSVLAKEKGVAFFKSRTISATTP